MASLIPQVEIAGPSAVARVKEIVNDSRQASRAALEQRLGVELELSGASTGKLGLRLPGSENVTLSPLARAVNALLVSQSDPALKIRGAEPLWLHSRSPVAAQLTVRLAQTVVFSGLFYESHLQQFATGLRPLALMVREPQASLATASSTALLQPPATGVFLTAGFSALDANTLATSNGPAPFSTAYGRDGKPVNSALLSHETAEVIPTVKTAVSGSLGELQTSSTAVAQAGLAPAASPADLSAASPDALTGAVPEMPEAAGFDIPDAGVILGVGKHAASAASAAEIAMASASATTAAVQDTNPRNVTNSPLPFATAYSQDGKPDNNSLFSQKIIGDVQATSIASAEPQGPLNSGSTATAVIHPAAMELVRQQLELLSVPVFRWCGQAWPGTLLEWDVQKEPPEDEKASGGQAGQPAWTTNLTLSMPVLKSVQARLTLAGNTLQLRLVCDEGATLAVLDESRNTLAQRFTPLGLQLATLHIGMADTASGIDLPKI